MCHACEVATAAQSAPELYTTGHPSPSAPRDPRRLLCGTCARSNRRAVSLLACCVRSKAVAPGHGTTTSTTRRCWRSAVVRLIIRRGELGLRSLSRRGELGLLRHITAVTGPRHARRSRGSSCREAPAQNP